MNARRVLGILIIIGGIVLLFVSNYIKSRVAEGEEQISSAQKKVDQGNRLFSLNPYSQKLGGHLTDSAQKKINEGKQEAAHYANLADQLWMGGIVAIIIGGIIVIIPRKTKSKR